MSAPARIAGGQTLDVLESIERRVLWLAMRIVDHANRERAKEDELKVGGHQASSASIVTLMTALYFADLARATTASASSRTPRPCCTRSSTCSDGCPAST